MTPEQKELEEGHLAAYAAWRADNKVPLEYTFNNRPFVHWPHGIPSWDNVGVRYRLAPPAEIPERNKLAELEEKDARAYSLFADLRAPDGYEELEYLGRGPIKIEPDYLYATIGLGDATWWTEFDVKRGTSPNLIYARARKLPTDQEKAEAALNAYKLEPGESLVHRGKHWTNDGKRASYLVCYKDEFKVYRWNDSCPSAQSDGYYAEIIKEPEMVPFTQETWPVDALQVKSGRSQEPVYFAVATVSREGIRINDFSGNLIRWSDLLNGDWYYRTPSTTWTRAGKGVGA